MNVQGLNLFPLNLLSTMTIPAGYYMDSSFRVYSDRSGGRPLQIQGSTIGGVRYYRFAGSNTNFRHESLKAACQSDHRFLTETHSNTPAWATAATGNPVADAVRRVQSTQTAATAPRAHSQNLEAGIQAKGYVIARVDGASLVLSSAPLVHLTDDSSRSELQRLALQKPGVKFVRLKITDSVVAGGITWQ